VEDTGGETELLVFPGSYQQTSGLWERDRVILVHGKVTGRDREGNIGDEVKIIVDDAREITAEQATVYEATGKQRKVPASSKKKIAAAVTSKPVSTTTPAGRPERIYIRLSDSQNQALLMSLKQMLDASQGATEVVLVLGPTENKQIIKLPAGIQKDSDMLQKLRELVGIENIKIQ
jgi:DNA polymerase III alpha subunit